MDTYCGTGILRCDRTGAWNSVETITTNESVVGVAVNDLNGKSAATTVFSIHYAADGVHIVPDYPSKKGMKSTK